MTSAPEVIVDPEPDVPASPDQLSTLTQTLLDDTDAYHRVAALNALSSLADQGYEINTIRDSLRLAAADDNPDVADRARDAYDHLIQQEESR